ncbi:WD40 repeat domain-containing protein [Rhizobium leguminosarum]|uniref:WD40 repeat domain-containing protein n=1 Tax=Rhizobium leguminosarum TaxID=384 RepID=UPI001C976E72|nr:hypothetical protein [Rhizobium leguminosarum]MBY5351320.1 hypothetical protein [Rhizobium leguminosarum]
MVGSEPAARSPLIAVTDGNLAWDENAGDFDWAVTDCLPSVLKARFAAEPLWIDLRNTKRQHELSLRYSAFRLAVLDLASPLHGRPKDELDGEDVRQHRRARATAWSAGIILAILAIVSTLTAVAAWEQSQIGRSRELAAISVAQHQSDPDVASILALESVSLRPTPQAESALRSAVGGHDLRFTLEGHSTSVSSLAFSPDGKWLASADRTEAIVLWDLSTGSVVRRWSVKGVNSLAFTSDSLVLAASAERSAFAWDVSTGALVSQAPEARDEVHEALYDRLRRLWILADEDDGLLVPNSGTDTGWRALGGAADSLQLVDGGRTLVTVSRTYARFWDVSTWELIGRWDGHPLDDYDSSSAQEAHALGVIGAVKLPAGSGQVVVARYRSGESILLSSKADDRTAIVLSSSGKWLATGGPDGAVQLWDVDWGRQLRVEYGHLAAVRSLDISADGTLIASAGDDARIRVWQNPMADQRMSSGALALNALRAALARGDVIVVTARAGPVKTLRARTGEVLDEIMPDIGFADCLAISAGGRVIARSGDGAWLWYPETSAIQVSSDNVSGCAFRGEIPVLLSDNGIAMDGKVLPIFESESTDRRIFSSAFDANGTHLVAKTVHDGALVWDLAQPRPKIITHPSEDFKNLEIAPDGRTFYTCGNFGPVRRFSTATLQLVQEISLGGLSCETVAASPNGRFIAVGGLQGRVVIFTLADGTPIKTLMTSDEVEHLRFGPESTTLIVTEGGGRVNLFDCDACLDLPNLMTIAQARLTRNLTPAERAVHVGAPSMVSELIGLADLD